MSGHETPTGQGSQEDHLDSKSLITRDMIKRCLEADKGKDATLKSFRVDNLTKLGDNYLGVLKSVSVQYHHHGEDFNVKYVAKVNPRRPKMTKITSELFMKEIGFYKEVGPALNQQLQNVNLPALRIPEVPFVLEEEEIIFMEDLREKGYRMFNRREELDEAHYLLVAKEMARLHAASVLLQKNSKTDLAALYPSLDDPFIKKDIEYQEFIDVFTGLVGTAGQVAKRIDGYEKVSQYLTDYLEPKCMSLWNEMVKGRESFVTINHGDFWNNNILFKYDDGDVPKDLVIVDLQMVQCGTPAYDLNYFLYPSLSETSRQRALGTFLTTYYNAFQEVLLAGEIEMPFSLKDLEKEYRDRNLLGYVTLFMFIPALVRKDGEAFNLDQLGKGSAQDAIKENENDVMQMLADDEVVKRFVDAFDGMIAGGIVELD
ncbi:uncharacterized protein LOC143040065 [Oratosquilla oratoria]|uniref:uncharacterized protein LOC143040065 n=1 Tax=Oratosquilla oratoria TaxID=337810 RepID=UPI003F7730AD